MADPLSAVGLGFGAASLILQIADECIKRYKYFTDATQMLESYQYLRVRVQMEQQRFLSFAMEAGLLYADGKICATLEVNQKILKDVLVEINSLFQEYEERNGKYEKIVGQRSISWDDESEPQTNLMELLCITSEPTAEKSESSEDQGFPFYKRFQRMRDRTAKAARKLRTVFVEPRRLVWVSVDQAGFEALVGKLKDLNSFLMGLLGTSHSRRMSKVVEMNYLELLQLRDDVKSLTTLIKALDSDSHYHHKMFDPSQTASCETPTFSAAMIEGRTDEGKRQYLRKLARLKIRRIEINQPEAPNNSLISNAYTSTSLYIPLQVFPKEKQDGYNLRERSITSWNNRGIWVEWIEQSRDGRGDGMAGSVPEERVILLTKLFCEEIPPVFRAPQCLGYTKSSKQDEESNFGIVFATPPEVDTESSLTTLRRLLGSQSCPTLTARISLGSVLADCLFSLHAVDWMHKGLRSDNILFFGRAEDEPNLSLPYVTGYDLSRPSDISELTAKPPFNPSSDVYRHPHAQSGEAGNFYHKSYDMYSLGVVLIEIALWKPLEIILGIRDLTKMEPHEVKGIHKQLLGMGEENTEISNGTPSLGRSKYLEEVAHKCGDSYRDIVELCLRANEVEKPAYKGESHSSVASRLRTMFKQQVTEKLQFIKEALSSSE